jgi:two-component system sensor histidine kinase KdpD
MDLGAVLAHGSAVALADDFAHRNAPGSRHRARWQDVGDLLAAGIDVISTIRVAPKP